MAGWKETNMGRVWSDDDFPVHAGRDPECDYRKLAELKREAKRREKLDRARKGPSYSVLSRALRDAWILEMYWLGLTNDEIVDVLATIKGQYVKPGSFGRKRTKSASWIGLGRLRGFAGEIAGPRAIRLRQVEKITNGAPRAPLALRQARRFIEDALVSVAKETEDANVVVAVARQVAFGWILGRRTKVPTDRQFATAIAGMRKYRAGLSGAPEQSQKAEPARAGIEHDVTA